MMKIRPGDKDAGIETRWRRLLRICDEAREQGGLLSQEDLAKLLMSDVRTIRRDIAELKDLGITVPTRGAVKDIGPGVTHKEIAIRLWLEGKGPTETAENSQKKQRRNQTDSFTELGLAQDSVKKSKKIFPALVFLFLSLNYIV